jgi:hypothetical protein
MVSCKKLYFKRCSCGAFLRNYNKTAIRRHRRMGHTINLDLYRLVKMQREISNKKLEGK